MTGLAGALRAILLADPLRCAALRAVAALDLPDCWIGAGFVRDAVWDHLHGRPPTPPPGDVDILWHDPARADAAQDAAIEALLHAQMPGLDWSVRNQARMHRRNGDAPYASVADAMRHWPETATAVAASWCPDGLAINAPLGLDDLFGLILRPAGQFTAAKRALFDARVTDKKWLTRYPRLTLAC